MNCLTTEQRHDYLDGQLSSEIASEVEQHLSGCRACRNAAVEEQELFERLRELPVPPATPGFYARAFRTARQGQGKPHTKLTGIISGAMAAAVVLGLTTLIGGTPDHNSLPGLTLTLGEVREVNLVFHSPRPLDDARLVMELPEQLEIEGFPGQRSLSWQTSLSAGENVLSIPLLATEVKAGELRARIGHGESEKVFRVNIDVRTQHDARTSI